MTRRTTFLICAVACGVVLAAVLLVMRGNEDTWLCDDGIWVKHGNPSVPMPTGPCTDAGDERPTDPRMASYSIEGRTVALKDGHAEESIPGSAAKIVTDIWTVSELGDLDGNGTEDAAVILTRTGGGSGTFFYLAAALSGALGYQGTNTFLLGDRIAPQNVSIADGLITVNYADRNPGEDFTVRPSVGKTVYAFIRNGNLSLGKPLSWEDLINVAAPQPNAVIGSPLLVTGVARGTWYFEASFPVELYDGSGNSIAAHYATAQGEWMTKDFVPFTAPLTFVVPATDTGTLVLRRDNPSGLPENDGEVRIPVRFR